LAKAEAYIVKMNTSVNYIIVGSHDPTFSVSLDATGVNSTNGTNSYAFPYHGTSGTAKALLDDIGSLNVGEIQQYVTSTNGVNSYTGRAGSGPNYSLAPGEGYIIKMNTTVSYIPSHY
jgi:hypothetical protein